MKSLQDIINAYEVVVENNQAAVLATIVKTTGSTYRKTGARALVLNNKEIIGLISGGCLEDDLLDEAFKVMSSGVSKVLHYDNTIDGDDVWGLGLGCAGKIDVLLERVDANNSGPINFISDCIGNRRRGVIATIYEINSDASLLGKHCMYLNDGIIENDETFVSLTNLDACLKQSFMENKNLQLVESNYKILIEVINIPVRLVVLGGGEDVKPVLRLARELGWGTCIVDGDRDSGRGNCSAIADERIDCVFDDVFDYLLIDESTAIVIMTHNYMRDLDLMALSLSSEAFYVAVLGSKKRSRKLLQDLEYDNFRFSSSVLGRLYGPAGLDIGTNTPEEIALSILAEIQVVYSGSEGGSLRNKNKPIHDNS